MNWEVLDLLKTASRQAASYLGQIEATEALLEARNLTSFNRMSAFVVHDLKNLVAQLSLMLRNAERRKDNPEFQRDMLGGARRRPHESPDAAVARRDAPLRRQAHRSGTCGPQRLHREGRLQRDIDVDLTPGVFTIGHDERLEHVIGHLVQNALDATAKGGAISVRLRRDNRFATIESRTPESA